MQKTTFSMQETKRLGWFISAILLEGLLTLFVLVIIPSETGSGFLFGYSKARLAMILGMFGLSVMSASFLIWLRRYPHSRSSLLAQMNRFSNTVWWSLLALFAIFFLLISFLLLQWLFIATDEYLRAYLQRLTPLLVFGLLCCFQGIGFVRGRFRNQEAIWKFRLLALGLVTAIPWLLIGEYFLADAAFPNYYVAERYLPTFRIVLPLGLFVTALYGQFLIHVLRTPLKRKVPKGLFVALLFVVVGFYYYSAATHHAEAINDDPIHSDQSAYMEFAQIAHETNFSYTGVRNQMPLYPYLQALFYQPEMSQAEFFAQGKNVNIILSLILLGALFLVFQNYLSLHRAAVLMLILAVGLFIFKAGYFTSELLYYSLSFLGFLGMGLMLLKPSLILGLLTGLTLAMTYLTKATILPAIVAFTFAFFVKEGITLFRKKRGTLVHASQKERIQRILSVSLVLISFLVLLSPYLFESEQTYGRYFYNVNSTFYIWYDTWKDALADTTKYGYLQHWPALPPDEIPGLRNYIRDHSFEEIKARLVGGLKAQFYYLVHPYSFVNYILIYSFFALLMIPGIGVKKILQIIKSYLPLLLFVLLNFFGYLLLFAWYFPIAGGSRFLYGLFLPSAFFSFVLTRKFSANLVRSAKKAHGFSWLSLFDAVILAMVLVDFTYVIIFKLPTGYFGS